MYDRNALIQDALAKLLDVFNTSPNITKNQKRAYKSMLSSYLSDENEVTPSASLLGAHEAIGTIAEPEAWDRYNTSILKVTELLEYQREPADGLVYPNKYHLLTDVFTQNPIRDIYARCSPGDLIRVSAGSFKKSLLKPRARGLAITFRGSRPELGFSYLQEDQAVGSTDSILLEAGTSDVNLESFKIDVDDRAGIKFEPGNNGSHNVEIRDCEIAGKGDAYDPTWTDDAKWGIHAYQTGDIRIRDCVIENIIKEHCSYWHNGLGDHQFDNVYFAHAGRCAIQVRNTSESGGKEGIGNWFVNNCIIEDVCLEDQGGGSALTFRGGMPTSCIYITDTIVRLGCDPKLAFPFNKNITGSFVCDTDPGGYKSGTKEVHLINFNAEVGQYFKGSGNAPRRNVLVMNTELLKIVNPRLIQWPGAHPNCLEIYNTTKVQATRANLGVVGKILFKGQTFNSWDSFLDSGLVEII